MFKHEKQKLQQNYSIVIGCDEVGRGALAGPVVACAVAFGIPELESMNKELWAKEVTDSKLLSPEKRSMLASHIRKSSLGFGIGSVSHKQIDKLNIHNASLLAMQRAVKNLLKKVSHATPQKIFIYVDGKFIVPKLEYEQLAVVGGDGKIFSVSSASIIAKVHRDNLMMKLHNKFPVYNFAQHKGYGTLQHRNAIKKHGLSDIHRPTFCSKIID